MRIIDNLKRFNTRRKALNELADVYLTEKYRQELARQIDNATHSQMTVGLSTTYPTLNNTPPSDEVLTEQQLQELMAEINPAAQISTYDDIKREKLDVINRRLGV